MFSNAILKARTNLKVLIVDDDFLMGEFLGLQIEALGCRATVVESGAEALGILKQGEVHLLVSDWQMPGMDGMELVAEARRLTSSDSHLHIAMMTARGEEKVMRAAMGAGVDDFLFKPVQSVELELVVASAARNRLLHHRLKRRNAQLAMEHRRATEALERVRADLKAATALHERLLPDFDRSGVLRLAHLYRPAAMLGGDSIGAAPLRGEGLLFFLIDVRGHGVPAALDSFHLHHRIKQLRPKSAPDLGRAMATINREICDRADDSYATIACGLIFPEKEEGWIVCAGHPPPLLMDGAAVTQISGGRAMPVGWFDDAAYTPVRFPFPPGARLVLYSDGITETMNASGDQFGDERLEQTLAASAGQPLRQFAKALTENLQAHLPSQAYEDDISMLAIEHACLENQS
ncbi:PP2C family protein-serine/threonine phosphatase [Novosphingobium beihaiensis]|uniref:SpoIIE family protein phosphatase n=1 Tax=Novosphingobium beihaiensis TaxID=2930389 RepID=A0ABT0BST9_9SPHN|nr:SpoIIE family protein phosphatase [Novosphingobium beihaiensis]MCJ2188119.1 SpoIIE family protein phosphatase [Novosphingobium beihaiensis]